VTSVRAGRRGDRDALEAVIRSDATFKPPEVAVALEVIDGALGGDPDYQLRVIEDGGAIAGYLCYGRTPMTERTFDLYWVCVDAAARGRGLAAALVAAMEVEIRSTGGGSIRVETSLTDGYGAARRLYEKLGYPLLAQLPDFYSPGDDLLTYYKRV
jgi:ribosomal protein S18 acetylase RimI-like enzyme